MGKASRIGPYSRPGPLAKLDNRTREARWMRRVAADLRRHVGGQPSAVQEQLIQRAAWLALRLAQLDAKIADGESFTEHDSKAYLAWTSTFSRLLKLLGMKPAAAKPPSLAELLAPNPRNPT